eukprot:CAMPEP_0173128792 /NCGR_PEP_ID=MMETSP1102-20130122/58760_1 /TAXON_ID=49646 /ORGANISM="Geminigera sp., Strain Caron Lab Isolate" /LENGTH=42 /DNA_ID= /DNA_START= /DNA_END= /DNA_ORIENTATION=
MKSSANAFISSLAAKAGPRALHAPHQLLCITISAGLACASAA